MTRTYARDPMARGEDLPPDVVERLVDEMRSHPAFVAFLAFDGKEAIGVATCLVSFSSFRAKRLMNIHDLCVAPSHRGRGVSRALVEAVEEYARANGMGGVTLEVYGRNHHARRVYKALGFSGADTTGDEATYFCFKEVSP
jgi:GNAT superfamily N-acetyltransferase